MTKETMQETLLELLPELKQFHDVNIQELVIGTWIDACDLADRDPEELLEMPFTLLLGECHVSFIQHTRGVTKTALAMAKALEESYPEDPRMHADHDVLLAGALLHDVGKVLEIGKTEDGQGWIKTMSGKMLRHPISGANLAFARGLPDTVLHCIACHSKEGDGYRKTLEAFIINHADFCNFEPLH
jgi:putative nucleotidyltransferase with HDIG domain